MEKLNAFYYLLIYFSYKWLMGPFSFNVVVCCRLPDSESGSHCRILNRFFRKRQAKAYVYSCSVSRL